MILNCAQTNLGCSPITLIFPDTLIFVPPSQRLILYILALLFSVSSHFCCFISEGAQSRSSHILLIRPSPATLCPEIWSGIKEHLLPEQQWMIIGAIDLLLHHLFNGLMEGFFLENFLLLVSPYKFSSIFWPTSVPTRSISHTSL